MEPNLDGIDETFPSDSCSSTADDEQSNYYVSVLINIKKAGRTMTTSGT